MLFRDTPLATVFCGPAAEERTIFCFSPFGAESLDEAGWRKLVFQSLTSESFALPSTRPWNIKAETPAFVCVRVYVPFLAMSHLTRSLLH